MESHAGTCGRRGYREFFFIASNPNESSVIAPANFRSIWTNLKEQSLLRLKQLSLKSILVGAIDKKIENEKASKCYPDYNWLRINCLPALPILKGAVGIIEKYDVVWLKIVLNEKIDIGFGCGLKEVDAFMQTLGFHQLTVTESNHPAVGDVLYVKNQSVIKDQKRLLEAREEQIKQLNEIHHQQSEELISQNHVIEGLKNKIENKDKRINNLDEKLKEQDRLQKSLNEEMIKAEAQIELIRDVLLREAGL